MKETENIQLMQFGFNFKRSGVHAARTIMLKELENLFSSIVPQDANYVKYFQEISQKNCLGKRTQKNRDLTARHLKYLYGLDPSILVFRGLRYYWERDEAGRPLLAFLCAYVRDPLLRLSAPYILPITEGKHVLRSGLEAFIENLFPHRFSKAMKLSLSENINSSWTQSGHLLGKVNKVRRKAVATPGTTAYALFLSYISGNRGILMLETEYTRLLDCSHEVIIDLAREASMRGWMNLKHISDVIEVAFPEIIYPNELEVIHD